MKNARLGRIVVLYALVANRKDDSGRLSKRLAEIDAELKRLGHERAEAQKRLALLRSAEVLCPKCGRDRDFLTDEGGYLAHVLEDPSDQELLTPGKALYCPDCGEVFLFGGAGQKMTRRSSNPRKKE